MSDILHSIYYNPTTGYQSLTALIKEAKKKGVSEADTREWYSKQKVTQVTDTPIGIQPYHKIIAPEGAQFADLAFLQKYAHENGGYNSMLILLDGTTRYARVFPLKTKTNTEIIPILSKFTQEHEVKTLTTDNEPAFTSNEWGRFIKEHDIVHYLADPNDHYKMGMIDRFTRTLKEILEKYFVANHTHRWIDVIDQIVDNYNHREHSTIKTTPADADEDERVQGRIRSQLAEQDEPAQARKHKLSVGDHVRVLEEKDTFTKGKRKWSEEVYTIVSTQGNSFVLNNEMQYRYHHLKKVDVPDEEVTVKPKPKPRRKPKIKELDSLEPVIEEPRERKTIKRYNPRTGKDK